MVCEVVIPSLIRAFMLFRREEVDDDIKRDLILAKLDYEDEETQYDQMETQGGTWWRTRITEETTASYGGR